MLAGIARKSKSDGVTESLSEFTLGIDAEHEHGDTAY